jgi:transcriptional regulator with PAS, ATPase and Fis domain
MEQDWPGNVRQLLHVLEAAAVIAGSSPTIDVEHLVEVLAPKNSPELGTGTLRLAVVRRKAEQSAIFEALRVASGNREQAASLLGISAATLYRKISPLEGSA